MTDWLGLTRPAAATEPPPPGPGPITPEQQAAIDDHLGAKAARQLAWLANPDHPARREALVRDLGRGIDALARPAGFTRKGNRWRREGARAAEISIQRSRYGFTMYLNIGLDPGNDHDRKRIGDFFRPGEHGPFGEPGAMDYFDLDDDPAITAQVLDILQHRALPWVTDSQRAGRTLPVDPYRGR